MTITVRHGKYGIDGPNRNRWYTPFLIAWWIFPWRTVSHNQMVTQPSLIQNLIPSFCSFIILANKKCPKLPFILQFTKLLFQNYILATMYIHELKKRPHCCQLISPFGFLVPPITKLFTRRHMRHQGLPSGDSHSHGQPVKVDDLIWLTSSKYLKMLLFRSSWNTRG